jgi:hypothetical protein
MSGHGFEKVGFKIRIKGQEGSCVRDNCSHHMHRRECDLYRYNVFTIDALHVALHTRQCWDVS